MAQEEALPGPASSVQLCYKSPFFRDEGDRHCAQAADVPSHQDQACASPALCKIELPSIRPPF